MPSKKSFNVKVAVRVRPLMPHDKSPNKVVFTSREEGKQLCTVLDPAKEYGGRKEAIDYLRADHIRERQYEYDHVFGEEDSTEKVFEEAVKPLVEVVMQGVNVTMFAYGQTGSGKTHTMLGHRGETGVMRLTLERLFSLAAGHPSCRLVVSFVELYNEEIRDLLVEGPVREKSDHGGVGGLELREDPAKGSIIAGVREVEAEDVETVMELLRGGNARRTQESTKANAESSRSHAILQIAVESIEKMTLKRRKSSSALNGFEGGPNMVLTKCSRRAKLCMIDLAGSERAAQTQNSGARLAEGARINRSLLALGNVINALRKAKMTNQSSEQENKSYVNFRDSKLTRLLKDSLGGNTRTLMLAHASPTACSFEETLNTLKYAHRARSIKNSVHENVRRIVKKKKPPKSSLASVAPAPHYDELSQGSAAAARRLRQQPPLKRGPRDKVVGHRRRVSRPRGNFDEASSVYSNQNHMKEIKSRLRRRSGKDAGVSEDALQKTRREVVGQLREAIELRQTVSEITKRGHFNEISPISSPTKQQQHLPPLSGGGSPNKKNKRSNKADEELLMRDPLAFLSNVLMKQQNSGPTSPVRHHTEGPTSPFLKALPSMLEGNVASAPAPAYDHYIYEAAADEQRIQRRTEKECDGLRRAVKRKLEKAVYMQQQQQQQSDGSNENFNMLISSPKGRHQRLMETSKDEQNALLDAEMQVVGAELARLELEARAKAQRGSETTDERDIHETALKKLELQVRLRNSVIKKLVHELERKRKKPGPKNNNRRSSNTDPNNQSSSSSSPEKERYYKNDRTRRPASAEEQSPRRVPASELFAEILGSHDFLGNLPKANDLPDLRPRSGGSKPGWRR